VTTTEDVTRPVTADQHAAEARRLLTLIDTRPLGPMAYAEYTAVFARDPEAVAAVANAHIALAQLEEQRTANLIALFREDGPEVFRADTTNGMSRDEFRRLDGQVRAQYLAVADDVARRVGLA
jgi:hypothetical protein